MNNIYQLMHKNNNNTNVTRPTECDKAKLIGKKVKTVF